MCSGATWPAWPTNELAPAISTFTARSTQKHVKFSATCISSISALTAKPESPAFRLDRCRFILRNLQCRQFSAHLSHLYARWGCQSESTRSFEIMRAHTTTKLGLIATKKQTSQSTDSISRNSLSDSCPLCGRIWWVVYSWHVILRHSMWKPWRFWSMSYHRRVHSRFRAWGDEGCEGGSASEDEGSGAHVSVHPLAR